MWCQFALQARPPTIHLLGDAVPEERIAARSDRKPCRCRSKSASESDRGILSGLRQIHIAKVIHLDVKPTNILFADNDDILVADFGQARDLDPSGVSRVGRMYCYGIPPEVVQTGHGSIESDVFQAGLTLYRAVNGHPFWAAEVSACTDLRTGIINGTFPSRARFLPHVCDRQSESAALGAGKMQRGVGCGDDTRPPRDGLTMAP